VPDARVASVPGMAVAENGGKTSPWRDGGTGGLSLEHG
jgi:hypothetical protein